MVRRICNYTFDWVLYFRPSPTYLDPTCHVIDSVFTHCVAADPPRDCFSALLRHTIPIDYQNPQRLVGIVCRRRCYDKPSKAATCHNNVIVSFPHHRCKTSRERRKLYLKCCLLGIRQYNNIKVVVEMLQTNATDDDISFYIL